jgi:hypothetical protein
MPLPSVLPRPRRSSGSFASLITRTIVPLVQQEGFPSNAMNESGLGDVLASQFFSPKAPTASGRTKG